MAGAVPTHDALLELRETRPVRHIKQRISEILALFSSKLLIFCRMLHIPNIANLKISESTALITFTCSFVVNIVLRKASFVSQAVQHKIALRKKSTRVMLDEKCV